MNIEKMREEFEAWASSPEFGLRGGHFSRGEGGEYLNYPTQCYFMVWQASRAAIEVELPKPYSKHRMVSKPERYARSAALLEAGDAIESLGLKIK